MPRVKKRDYEQITDSNIQKALDLLNPTNGNKPITKKEACEILSISYNVARLDKIFAEYLEHKEYVLKRKSINKGKRATEGEIQTVVTEYLQGDSISVIAKGLYRSPAFVKNIIEKLGVPQRPNSSEDRKAPIYLPEDCVAEVFTPGQVVWSAKYHSPAEVLSEVSVAYQAEKPGYNDTNYEKKYSSKCYTIYVMRPMESTDDFIVQAPSMGGFNAYSLACELGSLEHLKNIGIDLQRI